MKTKLLLILFLWNSISTFSQSIQIDQLSTTAVDNGINIHLVVTTFNGAGYLSHDYAIDGQIINLNVCYWFDMTLPVYQITNDFIIPIDNTQSYNIQLRTYHSSSNSVCNYYSTGPTANTDYLSLNTFEKERDILVYPNPTHDFVNIQSNVLYDEVSLVDVQGKLVLKSLMKDKIEVKGVEPGLYWLVFRINESKYYQKLIVTKQ